MYSTGSGQPNHVYQVAWRFVRTHRTLSSVAAIALLAAIFIPSTAAQHSSSQSGDRAISSHKSSVTVPADDDNTTNEAQAGGQTIQSNSSSVSTSIESNSQTGTSVTVNGQPVEVPANGNNHQVVIDDDGQDSVTVNTEHRSSNNGDSQSSSLNISVHSSSSSEESP